MVKQIVVLFLLVSLVLSVRQRQRWESKLTEAVFAEIPEVKLLPQSEEEIEPTYKKRSTQQNELVTITQWNYPIIDWAICSPSLIFAVSSDHSILVSRDSLMTFTPYPFVPKEAKAQEIYHNDFFPNNIMILGENVVLVSDNMGESFKTYSQRFTFSGVEFHPTDVNLALAVVYDEIRGAILFVTENRGQNWKELIGSISQYDWCRAGQGAISRERICIVEDNKFQYSNNLGKDWVTPLGVFAHFFSIHDRFFTLLGVENKTNHFYVSSDDGSTFHRAILPRGVSVGDIDQRQFLEDENGVIWIVVNPGAQKKNKSQKGNLYTSDAEGFEFSLVLRDVHTYNGYWDVDLISFMEGTLYANTLLDESSVKLRTKITYNNGDTWESLEAPDRDVDGQKINCRGQCSLHLFGITTWLGLGGDGYFGDLYTNPDAVGLIVGTGNVGNYLNIDEDKIHTYLSRDGGLTWDDIMDKSTIYDFGDFGGLLVLARNRVQTKKIFYSWDGGEHFSSVELPQKVVIFNIITISTHSEVFIVLSYEVVGNNKVRRIYGLDFGKLHTRNCTVTDYEEWVPHNGVKGPNCVLGHNIIYRRRKRDSACYTEEDINKIVNVTNCPCTDDDYECDVNYDRTEGSGKCAYDGDVTEIDALSRLNGCSHGEKTYKYSSGYRKVPGDTCVNEIEKYKPLVKNCPNTTTPSSPTTGGGLSTVGIAVAMTFLVLIALVVGFFFGIRDERVRQLFPFLNSAPAWVTAGYSNTLLVEGDEFEGEDNAAKSVDLSTSLSDE